MDQYTTKSEQQTKELAKEFADTLKGGEVIELIGELGSGKTTFVRGVVQALGSNVRVKSPTFTVMNEYPVFVRGIKKILHLDLYRFKDPRELEALALEDYIKPNTVVFVEWPNVFDVPLFENAQKVKFTFVDEETRKIVID